MKCSRIKFAALALWIAVGLPFCVVAHETQSSGLIAAGTEWETAYYIKDSGVKGPTVVLTGGIHGNEPAGFRAAEQIRHWPIVKGKLVVVPQANVPGLEAKTRYLPKVTQRQKDLNRNFVVGDDGEVMTLGPLATELWRFVREQEPDWVIDLHEGYEFHVLHRPPKGKKRSVGSTIIYSSNEFLDPFVERALAAANTHVTDSKRTFVALRRGPVAGSLARAVYSVLGANSMILETTFRDQPFSLRARQHRAMVNSLFNDLGLIAEDCSDVLSAGTATDVIQVGLFDGPGTGASRDKLASILDRSPRIDFHYLGPDDIRPEVLKQFDLVLFPGGSGSKQARALGEERREVIREFVNEGGGCVGICAGAYLCSAHYTWSLDLIDASVFTGAREIEGVGRKQMWYRGKTTRVDLELSEAGKGVFTNVPDRFDVSYHNGPILSPKDLPEIEDYRVLAWFRSEQVLYEPQRGTMIDTPAIVSGRFGEGRIISISPHPEADQASRSMIVNAILWCVGESPATRN